MRWALALLLVLGCSEPKKRVSSTDTALPVQEGAETPGVPGAVVTSCAVPDARPEPLDVRVAVFVGELVGQRWFAALAGKGADERALLLRLDAQGSIASTPLPQWTEHVALVPPHTLRFLVPDGSPKWWTVDVSAPDAPAVGAPTPVVDLVPGRFPKAFAADEGRALITLYESNPADAGPSYVGRTALFEVPSGRRLSADLPTTAWVAACHAGRCFAVASPNDGATRTELVEITPTGASTLAELGQVRPPLRLGNTWVVPDCSGGGELRAVDLGTGTVRQARLDLSPESCLRTNVLSLPTEAGLVWQSHDAIQAVILDAALRSRFLRLGDARHSTQEVAAVSDGFVVLDYDRRSGMMHSPSDREVRRYYWVWEFAGRAGFVPNVGGRLEPKLSDVVRLPHDGEHGTLARGYDAHLLTRGAFATAIVVGEQSLALRLRAPCAASSGTNAVE